MNSKFIRTLPTVKKILKEIPLSDIARQKILQDRQELKNIISGKDKRYIFILGPCSVWPREAVFEYADKLSKLNKQLKKYVKLVMRVYIQKPRSIHGWLGSINQPDIFSKPNIEAGIKYSRSMMIKIIEKGVPIADEALYTQTIDYFLDLPSWYAIGARSSEDQEHRLLASVLDMPVGLKNPTSGSLSIAANSVSVAQHPHVAVFNSKEIHAQGNHYAHLVLRGGQNGPNYAVQNLEEAKIEFQKHQILHPSIVIDASHDNCIIKNKKDHYHQIKIILDTVKMLKKRKDLRSLVKGFMLESFIKNGNQAIDLNQPEKIDFDGLSITDPCLGWEETELLLFELVRIISDD